MKVNKKQNSSRIIKSGNGMGAQPRKRAQVRVPSRNRNLQGSVAAAYSTGNSGRAPRIAATNDSCRVQHRELLGNVSSLNTTGAFVLNNTFALNPGLSATFLWLSNIAQNWESYRFNSLRVCYYTRTGSNTKGSVIMAPDYDASDSAPTNENAMTSYEDVQEDGVWKDITCVLRPAAMHNVGPRKFVRTGPLIANQDVKLYDVGNLFIATADSTVVESWGKLWIEYDVTFFTPQLQSFSGGSFPGDATIQGNTAQADNNLFGTTQVVQGGLGASGAANVLTMTNLAIGLEYVVSSTVNGTTITVFNQGGAAATGLTIKNAIFGGFPAAATTANVTTTYLATATTGTVTFGCTAVSVTEFRVIISAIPAADPGI